MNACFPQALCGSFELHVDAVAEYFVLEEINDRLQYWRRLGQLSTRQPGGAQSLPFKVPMETQ
jgi:hypothetical protein